MNPESESSSASSSILVIGFVKAPGNYSFGAGMTVEDALDEAEVMTSAIHARPGGKGSEAEATLHTTSRQKSGVRGGAWSYLKRDQTGRGSVWSQGMKLNSATLFSKGL